MYPSIEFLQTLSRVGHVRILESLRGTGRLEMRDGPEIDYWMIKVDRGDLTVWRGKEEAETIIKTERSFFDRVVGGETNALAALLRGSMVVEGNLRLALCLGKLLPGPPHSRWRGRSRYQGSTQASPIRPGQTPAHVPAQVPGGRR